MADRIYILQTPYIKHFKSLMLQMKIFIFGNSFKIQILHLKNLIKIMHNMWYE